MTLRIHRGLWPVAVLACAIGVFRAEGQIPLASGKSSLKHVESAPRQVAGEQRSRLSRVPYRFSGRITPEAVGRFLDAKRETLMLPADMGYSVVRTDKVPGGRHVRVQQLYAGIPVHGGDIVISMNSDDQVTMVSTAVKRNVSVATTHPSISGAAAISLARNFVQVNGETIDGTETATLTVYEDSTGEFYLSYRVLFVCSDPPGDWEVFVDAHTGEVLQHTDRFVHFQSVQGSGYVFLPDPISHARASYGSRGFADNNDLDSDSLNACRTLAVLDSLTYDNGWYLLEGPSCMITDIEAPHGIAYSALSADGFMFSRSQQGFEAVNAYYHISTSHRYLKALGFEVASLGRLRVDPHGLAGQDNSHYSPTGNWIAFGEGGVDDAEDAGVIWHEYAHAIQYNIIPEWGGGESQALGEGFGDYWAASYMRSLGVWDAGAEEQAWIFLWDGHNEYWKGRRTDDTRTYPFDGMAPHDAGQVWSSALMGIYGALGREVTDRLVLKSFYYLGYGATAPDAAEAILQADRDLYGGRHIHLLAHWLGTIKHFIDPAAAAPLISHTPVQDVSGASTAVSISAVISSEAGILPGTASVLWRVDSSEFSAVPMILNRETGSYSATIPNEGEGALVRYYYINVTDSNGVVATSPPGAPAALHMIDRHPVSGDDHLPGSFSLQQNFPNPFNPSTTIRFSVSEDAFVTLNVFDMMGREVSNLIAAVVSRGSHSTIWDGTNKRGESLSSGTYFYRIQVSPVGGNPGFVQTRKMILLH